MARRIERMDRLLLPCRRMTTSLVEQSTPSQGLSHRDATERVRVLKNCFAVLRVRLRKRISLSRFHGPCRFGEVSHPCPVQRPSERGKTSRPEYVPMKTAPPPPSENIVVWPCC